MTDRPEAIWRVLLSRRMLVCALTGFSSGLPLYVLITLIPAWLRDQGVDLETIGLMSLVGLPYTWKFVWAPLLDRYVPPWLGRRRGWALVTQIALALGLAAFGLFRPTEGVTAIAVLAVAVAVASATQDIALDAYRRELLVDRELGLGSAIFINAYRVAGLVPGGVALVLADYLPWSTVHLVTASFLGVGVLGTALAPDVRVEARPPVSLREAVVEPFRDLFVRRGAGTTLRLLAFLVLYKLGDSMATALITPFYLDVGFTKTQIGTVAKLVGLWSTILGAFIGGAAMLRLGIHKALWIFGVVQVASILGFAVLAEVGPDVRVLGAAVAFEYLGVGLGTAAFVAYLQRETNRRFTATQYALFSSLAALPRTLANAGTGWLVAWLGWTGFFLFCTLMALPGMVLLLWVAPWGSEPDVDVSG